MHIYTCKLNLAHGHLHLNIQMYSYSFAHDARLYMYTCKCVFVHLQTQTRICTCMCIFARAFCTLQMLTFAHLYMPTSTFACLHICCWGAKRKEHMFDSDYASTETPEHHTKSKYKCMSWACMHRHISAQCVRARMQDIAHECTDTPALSLCAFFFCRCWG